MSHERTQQQPKLSKNFKPASHSTDLSEENEFGSSSEALPLLQTAANAQPLDTTLNRAFYNSKLAGVQRQALVQRMGSQRGNQYIQRMLNHSCSADCGHLATSTTAKTAGNAVRRVQAEAAETEEKAPLQLSGVIKPTKIEGQPEAFCDSVGGKASLPALQSWIPELPNIIKSAKTANKNRPLEVRFNLGMNQQTEPGQHQAAHSHGSVMGHDSATINSKFGIKTQTKNSGNVAATGEEIFGYASGRVYVDGDWTLAGSILTVNATMQVIAYWAISGQGREKISGADDEKINSMTWHNVVHDLQTDEEGTPLRRKLYYVPSITAAHELYHVSDIFRQANAYAPSAKAWLDTQTVQLPASSWFTPESDNKAMIQFNLNDTLMQLSFKAEENIKEYIKNGGESRAYRAGKNAYDSLRGEIKQRAKDNGWELPKAPELRESLELQPGQKKL